MTFFFYSAWFDDVTAAVKSKYPKTRCKNEVLQNGFGAQFINTICAIEETGRGFSIERMFDNKSGTLSLSIKRPPDSEAQGRYLVAYNRNHRLFCHLLIINVQELDN